MSTTFPASTIVGYPRIGANRELKRAVESFWAGRINSDELETIATNLRIDTYQRLKELGLTEDSAIPASFSYYDQVLDATFLLGAFPQRFRAQQKNTELEQYFLLARGEGAVAPLEMTKWFNTNYHYLVPEIAPDTPISYASNWPVQRFLEAKEAGFIVRPTIVGPLTYLLLSKPAADAPQDFQPVSRLDDVVNAYEALLADLAEAGVPWVQFDEPALTSDNLGVSVEQACDFVRHTYDRLGAVATRPHIVVTTPYGEARLAVEALAHTPVEAIHVDAVAGQYPSFADFAGKTLVAGVINGRNIWRSDLRATLESVRTLRDELPAGVALSVSTSTSLQHVPYTTSVEKWEDATLDHHLHLWLAFAEEKVREVVALAQGLHEGPQAIAEDLDIADQAQHTRASAPGVHKVDVRARVESLNEKDRDRGAYDVRREAQEKRLNLRLLPSTTIGSFPQTVEIRQARAAHARHELDDAAYQKAMRDEVTRVIRLQEELDIDVLVHGEPERNDMVQYFAELLDGFDVTRNGWVQSYGSRCTRPSILWGDVTRSAPMTVQWSTFAQSLTDRPVKGMLTGPVTILAWSFVREDLPIAHVADQVAFALRDEVRDLEEAGIAIIQVDEPALRELLPLRHAEQEEYLRWSVNSFRLATSGVRPDTQIHTHLCYSEFGEVIDAIDALDADVTSLEAARSHMEVLPAVEATGFERQIGPGIYDIHSPRVPTVEELTELLREAVQAVPAERVWVNPDCGLKTRNYEQVIASLTHMVEAGKAVRESLANS
ncbi:5-methyltetrahydropteroyltriglutamate--homocysteine S-methyltransferase [Schaalia sp. lx-100]|uniref:5-methyltetrahydropteroyltriglutamate-- homocysteine S-methyltransferase n=1 Tax=Schaalia sp. lx-100 TaxID=2899081 RepID=UPI001E5B2CED|nr:5-methyltetrahydropteroyltriglutamate--homocysteine S-methyltransferase [Schaalia sp. lx-100]MCD4557593.1 5-methyltetrahydropteroyltriglutamate--homocysteine S-methyltransferase [Schaalia sp. lx-100]